MFVGNFFTASAGSAFACGSTTFLAENSFRNMNSRGTAHDKRMGNVFSKQKHPQNRNQNFLVNVVRLGGSGFLGGNSLSSGW